MLLADVKTEFHYVIGLHYVVFTFGTQLAGCPGGRFRPGSDEVVVIDDLGSDEAPFEVRVDDTSGLWCCRTLRFGPGADLLWSGGQIALQAKRIVRRVDKLGKA